MSKLFYQRLALTNLKKNSKTYVPYILTCIGTIIMFYNTSALTHHARTSDSQNLATLMNMGIPVIVFLSFIFLFYTNSFLVKRRKKEFGLFNILGMEKRHIGKIMLWETIYVSSLSIISGLALGITLNKGITLLLHKLLHFDPKYGFEINGISVVLTLCLFLAIFAATLISNLVEVYKAKPIELLKGGNVGEKEPKTKWLTAIIGFLTLAAGYAISIKIASPMAAIPMFLLAVILVIIGTYCLFSAGSIVALKLLRKNKKYYYQTKHFTTVSGMIYRMKQNAAGLANICILSTAVLVMLSTSVSMYVGVDDTIAERYPSDVNIIYDYSVKENIDAAALKQRLDTELAKMGKEATNYQSYSYMVFACKMDGNKLVGHNVADENAEIVQVVITTSEQYKLLSGNSVELKDKEIALFDSNGPGKNSIIINKDEYTVKEFIESNPFERQISKTTDAYCIVVADEAELYRICNLGEKTFSGISRSFRREALFDLDAVDEEVLEITEVLYNTPYDTVDTDGNTIHRDSGFGRIISKAGVEKNFYELYGGLLFLGIFLGGLCLMATALIIYYKQVVEGFDDKERFRIMQKVGMSRNEVKKSINSQVLTVFALPIVVAVIHIAFAFPILTKLLAMLGLENIGLFVLCTAITVLLYALVYAVVFALTARVYIKIVNQD